MLIAPVFGLRLGFPDAGNDPTNLTTRRAYDLMTDGFGAGFNGTFVLVADNGDDAAMATLADLQADAGIDARRRRGVAADRQPQRRRRRHHPDPGRQPAGSRPRPICCRCCATTSCPTRWPAPT